MWPYFILIGLPLILQHEKSANIVSLTLGNSRGNKRSLGVFWGILFFMVAFRHEMIGNDTFVYKQIFHTYAEESWPAVFGHSAEVGYSFLNKLISLITDNFRWVLIVCAFLCIYPLAKAYIKYSDDASLTISIFVIMSNFVLLFSGLRQGIAIALGVFAFEMVRNKKIILFVIVTVIAMLFHTSAFIIFFMYPLYYIKFTRKSIKFLVPILIVIWVFNRQIFSFLGILLNQFTDYDTSITETGSVTMLILFIIFAVFSYLIPEESKLDTDTLGMRNFLLLAVVIQMFTPLHSLAMRMNYYYIIFIPLLIPKIISFRSAHMSQVAIMARHFMVIFFLVYFFITAPAENVLHTFPYRFFWQTV